LWAATITWLSTAPTVAERRFLSKMSGRLLSKRNESLRGADKRRWRSGEASDRTSSMNSQLEGMVATGNVSARGSENLRFVGRVIWREPVLGIGMNSPAFQDGPLGEINFDSKLFFHRFSLIFHGYEGYENSGEPRSLCRLGRRQGRYRRRVSPYSPLLCT